MMLAILWNTKDSQLTWLRRFLSQYIPTLSKAGGVRLGPIGAGFDIGIAYCSYYVLGSAAAGKYDPRLFENIAYCRAHSREWSNLLAAELI
jgi:hypothetical protein